MFVPFATCKEVLLGYCQGSGCGGHWGCWGGSVGAGVGSAWPWHLPLGGDKVTNACWLTQAKPNLAGGCFKPR